MHLSFDVKGLIFPKMACINVMIFAMTILGIRMIIGTATKVAKQDEHLKVKDYAMDRNWPPVAFYGYCHEYMLDKLNGCGECWSCLEKYDKCGPKNRLCRYAILHPEMVAGCYCLY